MKINEILFGKIEFPLEIFGCDRGHSAHLPNQVPGAEWTEAKGY
jgi:hypothetical protein